MKEKFEIIVGTVPDREDTVAEIWGRFHLATVFREGEVIKVEFYNLYGLEFYEIELDQLLSLLNEAKKRIDYPIQQK